MARRTAGALALWLGLLTLATPVLAAPWVQTTSLPDGYSAAALVYASGFLYHTGGSSESSGFYDGTNVFYGQVNTNGTIGTWNNGTPQLWSLSGIERFDFMKTQRLITWSAILAVAGLAYWLAIPEPPLPQARIKVEGDTAQVSAAHSVCSYDYYFIPQNRTPEVAVRLH